MELQTPTIKNMYQQPKAKATMFQVVLLLIVIVLFGWFLLRPKMATLSQYRQQRDELAAKKQKLGTDVQAVHDLVSKMKDSSDQLATLDETLPIESRITRLQVLLSSLVQNSGMTLVNVSVDPGESAIAAGDKAALEKPFAVQKKLSNTAALVNTTGSYDQLQALLAGIENSRRILDVDSMDISAGADSELTVHLKLKAYYYTAPSAVSNNVPAK